MTTEKKQQSNLFVLMVAGLIASILLNAIGTYLVIMNIEYKKVGGKENYDILQKMQLQQIQGFVEQYKKNPDMGNQNGEQQGTQWTETQAPVTQLSKEQLTTLKKDSYVSGAENAKISILEYSDLECPYCKKLYDSKAIQNVLAANKDTVNYSFKHFPLEFHKNAQKESEALECAGDIGGKDAFFAMKEAIFTRTRAGWEGFALSDLAPLAKELKVDDKKFQVCLDSGKYTQKVISEQTNGNALFGIDGTPGSVIINNETGKFEVISWAQGQAAFENALKKVSE